MDKKAIIAVTLSLVIWMGWQKVYLEPLQKQAMQAQEAQTAELEKKKLEKREETKAQIDAGGFFPASERKKVLGGNLKAPAIQQVTLENSDTKLVVSNENGFLKSWELKNITNSIGNKSDTVQMGHVTGFNNQMELRFSDPKTNEQIAFPWDSAKEVGKNTVLFETKKPLVTASKKLTLDESGYGAKLEYNLSFTGEVPQYIFLDLFGSPKREHDQEGSIFGQAPDKVHVTYRDLNGRHSKMGVDVNENVETSAASKWLGLDTKYFILALTPPDPVTRNSSGTQVAKDIRTELPAVRGSYVLLTEGKRNISIPIRIYFGPKNWETLKAVDSMLTDAIDFGWTSFLAVPLLQGLKWLYSYVHNYGLAIIILTFLIKMILFPLTYKSTKSMAKMSKLQPQLNALREKYKDNKEKLNQEMMSFMKTNGYNPVGGCLPILLQMPIFFSLYRVLFNSMELYQAPFIGWIHDLSSPDPYFITPVFLAGLMFLQQKLTPNTATDPAQQKMLQIMPVMFGMFMLLLPAGLNIYMVVNSAVSIGQQYVLNRRFGITPARGAPKPAKA